MRHLWPVDCRNGDVLIEGSSISRIQCAFEIEPSSNAILFYDRSLNGTSQVFGEDSTPFELGRARKVVVKPDFNDIVGMGGVSQDMVRFKLEWAVGPTKAVEAIKMRASAAYHLQENPRLARTIDEAPTTLPSGRLTRLHTPGNSQLKLRFRQLNFLGSGAFAEVFEAINVDTGTLMAVKLFKMPADEKKRRQLHDACKREVETLSSISHPHIVEFIASEGWDGPTPKIFMSLKDGNSESLFQSIDPPTTLDLGNKVFYHMLQALDFLANRGIIHRDVKPENIMYTKLDGLYHFQLGDFGLCNFHNHAFSFVGSLTYLAPEINGKETKQTPKADVFSLFVTMLWLLNIGEFRELADGPYPRGQKQQRYRDIRAAIWQLAESDPVAGRIREMAEIEPDRRASAAQMLIKLYDGEGLSTPKAKVPALSSNILGGDDPTVPQARLLGPILVDENPSAQTRIKKIRPDMYSLGQALKQRRLRIHPTNRKARDLNFLNDYDSPKAAGM